MTQILTVVPCVSSLNFGCLLCPYTFTLLGWFSHFIPNGAFDGGHWQRPFCKRQSCDRSLRTMPGPSVGDERSSLRLAPHPAKRTRRATFAVRVGEERRRAQVFVWSDEQRKSSSLRTRAVTGCSQVRCSMLPVFLAPVEMVNIRGRQFPTLSRPIASSLPLAYVKGALSRAFFQRHSLHVGSDHVIPQKE